MSVTKLIVIKLKRTIGASKYLRDVLWQASGNTAAQVIGIAAMPLLTRLYAPSDFAALHLFTQLVGGIGILLTLRFEYLIMLPSDQLEADHLLGYTLRLGVFNALWLTPVLAVLPTYWPWLQSQGAISSWLWLVPISALAFSFAIGLQQIIQRTSDFRTTAIAELIGRCGYVFSCLAGALLLPNIVGLMVCSLVNGSCKLIWLLRSSDQYKFLILKSNGISISKSIRRLALSTSASNIISLISGFAPLIFISDQYGTNALGQYGLVVSTLYLPSTLIGQAIGQVYYQRACRMHGDGLLFKNLLLKTSVSLFKISVPLYALLAAVSPWAYPLIFGSSWADAGRIAPWLCLAAATGFISTPLDRTSIITNVWWYLMSWHLIRAISTIILLVILYNSDVSLNAFVAAISINSMIFYIIDFISSYYFSSRDKVEKKFDKFNH